MNRCRFPLLSLFALLPLTGTQVMAQQQDADSVIEESHPRYRKVSGVSGILNSTGSDSLNKLMSYWQEGFKKDSPVNGTSATVFRLTDWP